MNFRFAKSLVESLHRFLFHRGLHMQVMLRHIQIRVANHTLNGRQIHTQRLHLADVGVAAGVRRQHPNAIQIFKIAFELVPVVLGVKRLFPLWRLEDVWMTSVTRSRMLFIRRTHSIWFSALSCSVTLSAVAYCSVSRVHIS